MDSLNTVSQNQGLSSTESGISSMRNSKESLNSNGNSNSSLGDKSKSENYLLNSNDESVDLQLQIKDSLKKLSEQYYMSQYNNSSLFNYYCTPFLYINDNAKNIYYSNNKNNENSTDASRNSPFEYYDNI